MSEKHTKRVESKKRKAVAFIELIKSDSEYKESKMKEAAVKKEGGSGELTSSSGSENLSRTNSKCPQEQMSLSDQMFAEYKKMMRERQKASMQRPKVFLTLDELARDDPVQTSVEEVKVPPPLFMADIQHLLLYSLQGIEASIKPRWCRLLRVGKVSKVVAVVLDSVSSEEFRKFPESLPTLEQAFDVHIDMVSPLQYGSSAREDLLNVPISMSQFKKQDLQERKLNNNRKLTIKARPVMSRQKWSVIKTLRALVENPLIPVEDATEGQKRKRENDQGDSWGSKKRQKIEEKIDYDSIVSTYECDQYDRRWLLLNSAQMILEGIPTPISATSIRYRGYRFSKETYKEVTEKSPLYAVDCEMIQTVDSKMDLARVSIVDENLDVVLDTYVKPWSRVTNYVTQFSGITKEILDPVTTRLEDVQNMIQAYLPPDAILCGQSICSDLSSIKIFHPYIIDTSVIYNLSGERRFKTGLKRLSAIFLRRDIQCGNEGHSSVEDAQATMELVLLKLRNSMQFGDILMSDPNSIGLNIETSSPVLNSKCIADASKEDPNNPTDIEDSCSVSMESGNASVNQIKTESDGDIAVKNVTQLDNQKLETDDISSISETKDLKQSDSGVKEDSKKCSNLTKTLPSASGISSEVQQRRLFFQREGSNFIETFFQRIQKQKRLGAIVDESDSVPLYPESMPVVTSSDDRAAEKLTLDKIKDVGICFTHLYGYRNYLRDTNDCDEVDDEKTKACLWKLDRRFWKIMMGLPACSLFVVVLPGTEVDGQVHSAMAFAKIT